MRHRTRETEVDSGKITTVVEIYSISTGLLLQTITSEVSPGFIVIRSSTMDDLLGYSSTNPCVHSKWSLEASNIVTTVEEVLGYQFSDWRWVRTRSGPALSWIRYYLGPKVGDLFALPGTEDIDLDALADKFYDQLRAAPSGFFGFEFAKDLVHIFHGLHKLNIRKSLRGCESILKRFKISRKASLGGVRRALRSTSDGYLAYTFGVKPLVKDVISTLTAVDNFHLRLARLRTSKGGKVPVSVQLPFEAIAVTSDDPETTDATIVGVLTPDKTVVRMSGIAELKDNLHPLSYGNYISDYFRLGVFDAVGLGWELLPYSFVADWFLHVDKKIRAFQRDSTLDMGPFHDIRDVCISQKEGISVDLYVIPRNLPTFDLHVSPQFVKVGTLIKSRFLRNVPDIVGASVSTISKPGPFQYITGLALAIQRLLNRGRDRLKN